MQQIIQDNHGNLEVVELPEPLPPLRGVLVKNRYSLISAGTERAMVQLAERSLLAKARSRPDLVRQVIKRLKTDGVLQTVRKVQARLGQPVPLGYSCAGEVLVSTSDRFAAGDRVACAGFGYASHAGMVSVPQNLTAKIPAGVSDRVAATVTVGAIALQGVRIANPQLGDTVAVIGLGLLGQLTTMLLVASGCRVIGMDVNADRLGLAQRSGAFFVTADALPHSILAATGGRGVDSAIITAASRHNGPVELSAEICRDRGCIVVVGDVKTDLPRPPFYHKELQLRFARSYGPGRYDPAYEEQGQDYPYGYVRWTEQRNMEAYLELAASGRVNLDALVTHTFPIHDAEKAYDIVSGKRPEPHLGILISYPQEEKALRKVRLRAPSNSTRDTVRIGLIGAGNFATGVLLPHLKGQAALHSVCSRSGVSALAAARRFGFDHIASGADEIIHDPEVDLIVIASPHEHHASQVVQALRAGKAVFVEKPLAVNREELAEIASTHAEAPQPLMVGFNRRFAPLTARVCDYFAQRTEPLVIHYRVLAGALPPNSPWQASGAGGRIVGEVCHFMDWCRHLTGEAIQRIYAECLPLPAASTHPPDNLQIMLKFGQGSLATISYVANAHGGPGKEEITIMGAGCTAVLKDFSSLECYGPSGHQSIRSRADKGHKEELRRVLDGLRKGTGMPIPVDQLIEVTGCTFAVQDSLAVGEPVVSDSMVVLQ